MSADILREFTKDEIIEWVRDKGLFLRVNRHDLLYIRWKAMSQKAQADYQAELDRWDTKKPDFKKRDALAVEFNSSKDPVERLRLLEEISTYDQALQDHIKRTQALDKQQEKADAVYRQLEKAQR